TARIISQRFKTAVSKKHTYAFRHGGLMRALFSMQPLTVLDALMGGDAANAKAGIDVINSIRLVHTNPIDAVPDDQLLAWCNEQPSTRYPLAAAFVSVVQGGDDGAAAQWSTTARALLEAAPNKVEGFGQLGFRFSPQR